jgi:hypothetical protein
MLARRIIKVKKEWMYPYAFSLFLIAFVTQHVEGGFPL